MELTPVSNTKIQRKNTVWPDRNTLAPDFFIDVTEVTFLRISRVEAGKCAPAKPRYSDYSRPNQPMVGVSWHEAQAYCLAQGKRLPTEAQWEKAARGTSGAGTLWQ